VRLHSSKADRSGQIGMWMNSNPKLRQFSPDCKWQAESMVGLTHTWDESGHDWMSCRENCRSGASTITCSFALCLSVVFLVCKSYLAVRMNSSLHANSGKGLHELQSGSVADRLCVNESGTYRSWVCGMSKHAIKCNQQRSMLKQNSLIRACSECQTPMHPKTEE